jgi:hypothetical protein
MVYCYLILINLKGELKNSIISFLSYCKESKICALRGDFQTESYIKVYSRGGK